MKNLIRQLTNPSTRDRLIKESGLEELICLIKLISGDLQDGRYVDEWKLHRLGRERQTYEGKKIPERAWPPTLRGQDWAERAWKQLTGEPELPEGLMQKYDFHGWVKKYWVSKATKKDG
jgi:hypothetical protein